MINFSFCSVQTDVHVYKNNKHHDNCFVQADVLKN
jgi:hypothetical protein